MPSVQAQHVTTHRLMVDSSALIALFDETDQFHKQAISFRDTFILNYRVELYTSNYIYAEVMSHLTKIPIDRLRTLDRIIRSPSTNDPFYINQFWIDRPTLDKALSIYFKYKDNDFSIADCTSFILMQINKITAAFAFDDDYKIYIYREGNMKKAFWKLPEMLSSYLSIPQPRLSIQ